MFARTPPNMTEERKAEFLKKFREHSRLGTIVVSTEKLIFVYSWRGVQQHTMIILADSREEADQLFKEQEPDTSFYVNQLQVNGGVSTIIYNN